MEKLRQRLLHRYPELKISYFNDVISKCKDTNILLTLLSNMRKHEDRFIIIENINKNIFREFAHQLIGDGEKINKMLKSYEFIIIRGEATSISSDDNDELEFILKQVFDKLQPDCHICYNQIEKERITCYHCKNEICLTCAQELFETTAYWCPFCGHHYIYPQLGKPSNIEQDMTELEFHLKRMIQQCKSYITDRDGKLTPHTT